ncbi:uncharacterized protein LOC111018820 [Momordica charantia]|uniref:Uncharacterized protein LOC111018820 n=1 Tax=Momordica charantia TaxID=3673 RepID=A0A6J1DB13_MOMCH|nr:uncharacterized protein LOC111018820 [Momordica charantia]
MEITPTIKEYHTLLQIPLQEKIEVYSYDGGFTLKRAVSLLVGKISAGEIEKHVKRKGENTCLPIEYILSLQQRFVNEERELSLLALCLFNLVLFPKVSGYVEERLVKLFVKVEMRVNLVIPILAETFRALNFCRSRGVGKFIGCAQLLYIWILSHINCPPEFKCPQVKFSRSWSRLQNPILEFNQADWSQIHPGKEEWSIFFAGLRSEDVEWRARWMSTKPMMYRCGKFHSLPLLGPCGCVSYAPLMVLRQIWVRQFIPATHDLRNSEFAYDVRFCKNKIQEVVKAWKAIVRIQSGNYHDNIFEGYEQWHSSRGKTVVLLQTDKGKGKLEVPTGIILSEMSPNQSTQRKVAG